MQSKKKSSSPQNDSGRKGVSEPVIKISSGPHRHVDQTISMKNPRLRATQDGLMHHRPLGSVMQDASSVKQPRDAVNYAPMSSAAGHNLCQLQFNEYLADQQRRAVQSDIQTSRVGTYASLHV